jgi:hypothetical protein
MKNITIVFTEEEIAKMKKLVKELHSFYDYDLEYDNHTEVWDFEDVDAQREIALNIASVLQDKF